MCEHYMEVQKKHITMRVHPLRKCIDSDNNDTQEQLYKEEELILDGGDQSDFFKTNLKR